MLFSIPGQAFLLHLDHAASVTFFKGCLRDAFFFGRSHGRMCSLMAADVAGPAGSTFFCDGDRLEVARFLSISSYPVIDVMDYH